MSTFVDQVRIFVKAGNGGDGVLLDNGANYNVVALNRIGVAATMAPLVILTPAAGRPVPEPLLTIVWSGVVAAMSLPRTRFAESSG